MKLINSRMSSFFGAFFFFTNAFGASITTETQLNQRDYIRKNWLYPSTNNVCNRRKEESIVFQFSFFSFFVSCCPHDFKLSVSRTTYLDGSSFSCSLFKLNSLLAPWRYIFGDHCDWLALTRSKISQFLNCKKRCWTDLMHFKNADRRFSGR